MVAVALVMALSYIQLGAADWRAAHAMLWEGMQQPSGNDKPTAGRASSRSCVAHVPASMPYSGIRTAQDVHGVPKGISALLGGALDGGLLARLSAVVSPAGE
jgi:hypothetical protein